MKLKNEISSSEEILLSICVITYGHEAFIRHALDSILMQKVDFKYEVIVGEDCSPDETRKILKCYESEYPNFFKMIYRDSNLGGRLNAYDLYLRSKGKYIAVLEGDDFWIDENKLQKQIDFLENNSEYIATAHRVKVVDEYGQEKNERYPTYKELIYTIHHYQKGILPGQTGTIVRRNYHKDYQYDYTLLNESHLTPGDQVNAMLLVSLGPVYCFPEKMSAYRHVTSSGTSYSAGNKRRSPEQMLVFWSTLLEFSRTQTKNKTMIKYLEKKKGYAAIRCLGKIKFDEFVTIYSEFNHKWNVLFYILFEFTASPMKKITKVIKNRKYGEF